MISEHIAALAWYAALFLGGGLVFAPFWISYSRRETLRDIERYHRRRLRELERR